MLIYAFVYALLFSSLPIVCVILQSLLPVAVVVAVVVLLESRFALQGLPRLFYPTASGSGRQSSLAK